MFMQRSRTFFLKLITIVSISCLSLSAWGQDEVPPTVDTSKLNNPPKVEQTQLPRQEIDRFVTAISLIKQYYIKSPTDEALFSDAIKGMVSNLDPHSAYLDAEDLKDLETAVSGEFVGIGVELTTENGILKVISPIDGTPAARAGLKPNDLIIKIDNELVQNMTLEEAVNKIKGNKGTKVTLTIIRKGSDQPITLTIMRDTVKVQSLQYKVLNDHFGYIRLSFFQGPVDEDLNKAIDDLLSKNKVQGLILDLRNNPGGLLDVSGRVASTFLDKQKTEQYNSLVVYTKGRIPGSDMQIKVTGTDKTNGLPLVVLINEGSASASEIVAGALQDYHRAVIMGTASFGKGSVQTVLPVDDGAIKLTTALYYTPAGRVIQAKGIQPDVVVPPLEVTGKETGGILDIDEENYKNHLSNDSTEQNTQELLAQYQKERETEVQLAKDDYQLFAALMMLQGMSTVRK